MPHAQSACHGGARVDLNTEASFGLGSFVFLLHRRVVGSRFFPSRDSIKHRSILSILGAQAPSKLAKVTISCTISLILQTVQAPVITANSQAFSVRISLPTEGSFKRFTEKPTRAAIKQGYEFWSKSQEAGDLHFHPFGPIAWREFRQCASDKATQHPIHHEHDIGWMQPRIYHRGLMGRRLSHLLETTNSQPFPIGVNLHTPNLRWPE